MNSELIKLVQMIIKHEQELVATQGTDFNAVLTLYQILDTEYSRCLELCRFHLKDDLAKEIIEKLYNHLKERKERFETYAREMNDNFSGTFPYDDFFDDRSIKSRLLALRELINFATKPQYPNITRVYAAPGRFRSSGNKTGSNSNNTYPNNYKDEDIVRSNMVEVYGGPEMFFDNEKDDGSTRGTNISLLYGPPEMFGIIEDELDDTTEETDKLK